MSDSLDGFSEPASGCDLCPRLVTYRGDNQEKYPDFFNAPVPSYGGADATFLIVGLAPGLKGANWSGRPFTGDYAGDLLYGTLTSLGFAKGTYGAHADDGLVLNKTRITNVVRCAPPQNKVVAQEIAACGAFLSTEINALTNLKAILALGTVAHGAVLRQLEVRKKDYPFGHGARHVLPDGTMLFDSYHCSRYNTNTNRLTEQMFHDVFIDIRKFLEL